MKVLLNLGKTPLVKQTQTLHEEKLCKARNNDEERLVLYYGRHVHVQLSGQ